MFDRLEYIMSQLLFSHKNYDPFQSIYKSQLRYASYFFISLFHIAWTVFF